MSPGACAIRLKQCPQLWISRGRLTSVCHIIRALTLQQETTVPLWASAALAYRWPPLSPKARLCTPSHPRVRVEKVDQMDQLMRDTGMWEGRDGRKIDEILGWDDHGWLHLKRWMKVRPNSCARAWPRPPSLAGQPSRCSTRTLMGLVAPGPSRTRLGRVSSFRPTNAARRS